MALAYGISSVASAQPHDPPHPGDHPGEPPHPGDHDKDKDRAIEMAKKLQDVVAAREKARTVAIKDTKAWERDRDKRAEEHRKAMEGVWGETLIHRPECQPELALYGDHMARLERIVDIGTPAQVARARALILREQARHARAMEGLRIRLGLEVR
jgi:hypothetical protein